MDLGEVSALLVQLEARSCRHWVAGGWAVDALVGRQTRPHRDLDLAIDARDEPTVLETLVRHGYEVETDWRPVRVELVRPGAGWVDLHPVAFDAAGHGQQADLAGGHFDYPPSAFTVGTLAGRPVPCLSPDQQLRFRDGYELRSVDLHDLEILRSPAVARTWGHAP